MRTLLLTAVAAALLAAGCRIDRRPGDRAPTAVRPDILREFWFIPGSRVRDTTGSAEAQRKQLTAAMPLDTVRAIYRERLAAMGWRLLSDVGDTLQVAMHARKDSSLVWLNLERSGPGLTTYTVIGARARPDTTRPEMLPAPR
jgi:hypothetical protein